MIKGAALINAAPLLKSEIQNPEGYPLFPLVFFVALELDGISRCVVVGVG